MKVKNIADERGVLSVIQDVPFEIKRVYWIKMTGKERGGHAHYKTRQCIACIEGKLSITLDDGKNKRKVTLNANQCLILEPNFWHVFCGSCIVLVLASEEYDEKDYIRSYEKFKEVYG